MTWWQILLSILAHGIAGYFGQAAASNSQNK